MFKESNYKIDLGEVENSVLEDITSVKDSVDNFAMTTLSETTNVPNVTDDEMATDSRPRRRNTTTSIDSSVASDNGSSIASRAKRRASIRKNNVVNITTDDDDDVDEDLVINKKSNRINRSASTNKRGMKTSIIPKSKAVTDELVSIQTEPVTSIPKSRQGAKSKVFDVVVDNPENKSNKFKKMKMVDVSIKQPIIESPKYQQSLLQQHTKVSLPTSRLSTAEVTDLTSPMPYRTESSTNIDNPVMNYVKEAMQRIEKKIDKQDAEIKNIYYQSQQLKSQQDEFISHASENAYKRDDEKKIEHTDNVIEAEKQLSPVSRRPKPAAANTQSHGIEDLRRPPLNPWPQYPSQYGLSPHFEEQPPVPPPYFNYRHQHQDQHYYQPYSWPQYNGDFSQRNYHQQQHPSHPMLQPYGHDSRNQSRDSDYQKYLSLAAFSLLNPK